MIRPPTPADVPRLFELVRELAIYEKLEHRLVGTPELLNEHLFGQTKYVESLVVDVDGELVGYALFFPSYSSFLMRPGYWLEDVFVEPAHRGKGYGKGLLREIARLALAKGFGRVDWAVLDWNQPSIDFYNSIGAFPMSDWITYRFEGDILARFAEGIS